MNNKEQKTYQVKTPLLQNMMGCSSSIQNEKTSRILVLGASGTIGTATVNLLAAQKINVTAGVRDTSKERALSFQRKGIKLLQVDMSQDSQKLAQLIKGYDSIFIVSPGHIDRAQITINAAKAAEITGASFILVVSVPYVEDEDSIFGQQFRQVESEISKLKISYAFLRLHSFTENNYANIKTIRKDGAIYAPIDGNKQFVTVCAQDVASVASKMLVYNNQYNKQAVTIVSDIQSMNQIAESFSKVLNKTIKFVQVSLEGAKSAMISAGLQPWEADGINQLYKFKAEGRSSVVKESQDFKKITNQNPTTTLQWIKNNQFLFSDEARQGIIVLGASGNMGTAAVKAILTLNDKVTAGVRDLSTEKSQKLSTLGAQLVKVDMGESIESLSNTLKKYNAVYLVIPGDMERAKISKNTIEAAKIAKVDYVLVISIPSAIYLNTIFGEQCGEIEKDIKESGISYGILRLPSFMDNFWNYVGTIKNQGAIYGPIDGKMYRANISSEDTGLAAAKILLNYSQHQSATYTLTSNTETLDGVAEIFSSALQKKITYTNIGQEAYLQNNMKYGLTEQHAKAVLELYQLSAKGDPGQNNMTQDVFLLTGKQPTSCFDWMLERADAFK